MRRYRWVLILLTVPALATLTPERKKENLASFDSVWNTVRTKHWDPALGGVNWDAIRAELRPRMEAAESEEAARSILADMLSRLHQSHFAVIPSEVYHDVQPSADLEAPRRSSGDATPGFDIRVVDAAALVTSVEPGSPAARAGVKLGWIVDRIDAESIAPALRRVSAAYSASTLRGMMLQRAVLSRLEGPATEPVTVEFRNGLNQRITLQLDRRAPRGTPAHFGYLPDSSLWIETRRIGNIGYITFTLWLDPTRLMTAIETAVHGCASCDGIVIDVRGNPGGIGMMASGLAGFFIAEPDRKLGTMTMRGLPLKFVIFPRPPVFTGPLAVLIDGLSASTSEIFAGGMQDLKRARLFGTPTAGAALPSLIERLPNGDGFQYAAASYRSEGGKTLEGAGVLPDEAVPLTRSALLSGRDPQLDAALNWIRRQSRRTSP